MNTFLIILALCVVVYLIFRVITYFVDKPTSGRYNRCSRSCSCKNSNSSSDFNPVIIPDISSHGHNSHTADNSTTSHSDHGTSSDMGSGSDGGSSSDGGGSSCGGSSCGGGGD